MVKRWLELEDRRRRGSERDNRRWGVNRECRAPEIFARTIVETAINATGHSTQLFDLVRSYCLLKRDAPDGSGVKFELRADAYPGH
jgi:hypothetical protein